MRFILSFLCIAALLGPLPAEAALKASSSVSGGPIYVTPTGATTASAIADIFARRYDAMDFGAQCDGATDDTAAFTLASQTASTQGGGTITKPASKSCVVCGATIYRLTKINGGGINGGEIIEKTGCTTAAFQSENFAANAGTGKYYGHDASVPAWMGVEDMRINASGGALGNGIQLYGNMPILKHVYVYKAYGDGIYTEASPLTISSAGGTWQAEEESYIEDWYANGSRHGVGFRYRGGYDGHIGTGLAMFNYSCGFRSEVSSTYSGGLDWMTKLHTYGNGVGDATGCGSYFDAQVNAGFVMSDGDNITMTGNAIGSHISQMYQYNCGYLNIDCLTMLGNDIVIVDYHGFINGTSTGYNVVKWSGYGSAGGIVRADITGGSKGTASVTGLKLTSNGESFTDINVHDFTGASNVGVDMTGQNNRLSGKMINNTLGLAYSGYNANKVSALINTSTGQTAMTGSPAAGDTFDINYGGTTSGGLTQFGGDFTARNRVFLPVRAVYSGTSDTAGASDYTIQWNSSAAAAKAQAIAACSSASKGLIYVVKDGYANAATYNITVTPASGTIDGAASYVINTNKGVVRLQCDGTSNWVVI